MKWKSKGREGWHEQREKYNERNKDGGNGALVLSTIDCCIKNVLT